jgi:hypothetical protein
VFEDGLQERDFMHVSDIVAACIVVIERDDIGDIVVNIGTGRATNLLEVAALLRRHTSQGRGHLARDLWSVPGGRHLIVLRRCQPGATCLRSGPSSTGREREGSGGMDGRAALIAGGCARRDVALLTAEIGGHQDLGR